MGAAILKPLTHESDCFTYSAELARPTTFQKLWAKYKEGVDLKHGHAYSTLIIGDSTLMLDSWKSKGWHY